MPINAGKRPVPPDILVDLKYRNGRVSREVKAGARMWELRPPSDPRHAWDVAEWQHSKGGKG